MTYEIHTSACRRALIILAGIACIGVHGSCSTTSGGTGTNIPFGTSTIRPIQAGDSITYSYSRVFANNSRFDGMMTETVSPYSSATLGQGLTVKRTFTYDTFAPNGTKGSPVTRTEEMSLIPVGGASAVTDFVEQNNDGTVTQVATPPGGVVLPFYDGTLESGQTFSFPFTLSDGTSVTEMVSVLDLETVTVPYGTVATLKVTSTETSQGPARQSSTTRTAWRHPVLGLIKRVSEIADTPTGGTTNNSEETIELTFSNIAVGQ